MEKTITLYDIQYYLKEIDQLEKAESSHRDQVSGPSNKVLQNILRYSKALNIIKTSQAGTIFMLVN